jgi:putative ABC transport system permease protein
MSLALSTLLFEWRRYLAAVIALALAGVLMLALSAMFIGITVHGDNRQVARLADHRHQGQLHGGVRRRWRYIPKRVVPLIYRHPMYRGSGFANDFGQFLAGKRLEPRQCHGHRHDAHRHHLRTTSPTTCVAQSSCPTVGIDASAVNVWVKLGEKAI